MTAHLSVVISLDGWAVVRLLLSHFDGEVILVLFLWAGLIRFSIIILVLFRGMGVLRLVVFFYPLWGLIVFKIELVHGHSHFL